MILTNQDWLRLKYTNNYHSTGAGDELIGIIGEMPVLLEETEALLKQSNISDPLIWALPLIRSYASIAQRLYFWQEQLRGTSDTPLYWAAASQLSFPPENQDAENLFPIILQFRHLNDAIPLILSWAVLVQLHCSLSRIYELSEKDFSKNHARNSLEDYQEWPSKAFCIMEGHKLTRLLCQSLEYCHNIDIGMLGPQACTYPQWIVRRYFYHRPGHERELKWCDDFRTMVGAGFRCGIKMMDFGGHTQQMMRNDFV
jgi:hypothetical protein